MHGDSRGWRGAVLRVVSMLLAAYRLLKYWSEERRAARRGPPRRGGGGRESGERALEGVLHWAREDHRPERQRQSRVDAACSFSSS
jgi:hypothetical protein